MSLNERFGLEGGFVGLIEWVLNTNREQKWTTLLARDVLESGMNFEDSVVALSEPTLLAPIYYIVGGAGKSEVTSFFLLTLNKGIFIKILFIKRGPSLLEIVEVPRTFGGSQKKRIISLLKLTTIIGRHLCLLMIE